MKTPRLYTLAALAMVVLASSCAQSKELTRSSALTLIKESKEFKEPATITLKSNDNVRVKAKSEDDAQSDAQAKAIELFFQDHPSMAVLQHLGWIEVKVTLVKKPEKAETPILGAHPIVRIEPWIFSIQTSLTDKGKKEGGVSGKPQEVILYKKEVLEVTGITKSQNERAQAEFTWRALPSTLGEAFDTNSQAYKNLPPNLQQLISQPRGVFRQTPTSGAMGRHYSGTEQAIAIFQKYDDGWRFVSLQ